MILYHGKTVPVFLGSDDLAGIFFSDSSRKVLCPAYLVIFFIAAEADRKGLVNIGDCSYIA